VSFGGSTYIALAANTASEPDLHPQVWSLLAQAGSAGPSGPSGPTGAAATVAVGTVTTGAAGTQAAVTNSGSSTAAVLNFTIPQGASGPPGGGGSGGILFGSVYHSVQNSSNYPYYSVSTGTGSTSEAVPHAVLSWMPAGCTATSLNVYSEQGNTITVTLRVGSPGNMVSSAALSCTVATGNSCTALGSESVPAGGFVDLMVSGANGTPAGVWTALACS
jgi:hypothetical protein